MRSLDFPRLANVYMLGSVDESEIPLLARYDLLVLGQVWTNEQLAQLRALNPDIKLFMVVNPYSVKLNPFSLNQFKVDLYEYASKNDLWWYNTRSKPASDWPKTWMVNPTDAAPAGSEGSWRRWLVRRIVAQLQTHPEWDGIFLDNFWERISWAQPWLQLDSDCNPTHHPEGCDGTADSRAELDAAWSAAMWDVAKRLNRELRRLRRRTPSSAPRLPTTSAS
ncbi:MAG: putative glycoside hydrolase [Candidatus Krumholzibacteriia bacterium]